jgi:hypothetical protein
MQSEVEAENQKLTMFTMPLNRSTNLFTSYSDASALNTKENVRKLHLW